MSYMFTLVQIEGYVTFLSLNKKVTKEVSLREGHSVA